MFGLDPDGHAGVRCLEGGEPRHQPPLGDRLDRYDTDSPGPAALALRGAVYVGEDALDLPQVGLAAAVEAHPTVPAAEERDFEILLQHPHTVGDGARGDAELLGRVGEALEAGCGLEEAQAFERGQMQHATNFRTGHFANMRLM